MGKIVRVLVKSSGKIQGLEESAAQRMAKAAPQEYQILETPKIEVTAIPEKKSDAGLVGNPATVELNAGNAIPSNKPVSEPIKAQTTEEVLQPKPKMGRPRKV